MSLTGFDVPLANGLFRTSSAASELTLCSSSSGKRKLSDILVHLEGIFLSAIGIPEDSRLDGAGDVTEEGMCWFCNVLAWLRLFLEALRRIMAMRLLLSFASADVQEVGSASRLLAPTREENVVVTC